MIEIEGYTIVRPLGSGGMAQVFLAVQTSLGREVALKILSPALAHDPLATERFLREARTAAKLHHPNIVAIHDVGISAGVPYMAMEYEPGGTAAPSDGRPYAASAALRIVREIGAALDHAHHHGVIHRDVKPDNILLRADGSSLLSDFGIARAVEAQSVLTREGTSVGTPQYMSPEQLGGEAIDGRSDLYSLGVVLFQLLTARLPFTGSDGWAIGVQHISAPIPRLPADLAHLQPLLDELMAKSPDQRPSSGAEVVRRIERLLTSEALPQTVALPARPVRRNLPVPALIASLSAIAVIALLWWKPWANPPSGNPPAAIATTSSPSIAVLPFADMSQAQDQEYFSDGLSEELLDRLAKIPQLRVVARTSSFSFKGKRADAATISKALNVSTLLEGSVRKSGDRLRVTAQLIRAADSSQIWSETYDRQLTDVFAVQEDIARSVVSALKLELLPQTTLAGAVHHVPGPAAYDQFLLGRQSFNRGTSEGARQSLQAYREAIRLDPAYAAAFAGLSVAEYAAADGANYVNNETEREQGRQRAIAAAEQAIALDQDLSDGYGVRGFIRLVYRWDWAGAQQDFDRALTLNPGDTATRVRYARLLATLGRLPEAIAAARVAIESDPLSPAAWDFLGRFETARGDLGAARQALNRVLAINPEHGRAPVDLALVALIESRPEEARGLYEHVQDEPLRLMGIAMAEHDLQNLPASRQALDQLILKFAQGAAYQIAEVYAWCDDKEAAFQWLERAIAQRDGGMQYLKYDPALRSLRNDPRYLALLRTLALPESPVTVGN